jgi:hypothetical protein
VPCPFYYPAVAGIVPIGQGAPAEAVHLYVVCPSLARAVSEAEERGAVERLQAACRSDEALLSLLDETIHLCRQRQADLVDISATADLEDSRLGAGLGGSEAADVTSCLHAFAATLLAAPALWGNDPSENGTRLAPEAKLAWDRFLPPLEECWCRDGRCSRTMAGCRRGVIVMGGTSVRMLVADIVNDHPWGVLRRKTVTKLSPYLSPMGSWTGDGGRATVDAVAGFAGEARERGVDSLLLAGTHRVLEAPGGEPFLYDVGREIGLPVAVLPAAREAEYVHAGVSVDVKGRVVVLYIGDSASTLIASSENGVVESHSFGLGIGRTTGTRMGTDPPTAEERAVIYSEVSKALYPVRRRFEAGSEEDHLVGIGGTIASLACTDGRVEWSLSKALHLRRFPAARMGMAADYLSSMETDERPRLPRGESWGRPAHPHAGARPRAGGG